MNDHAAWMYFIALVLPPHLDQEILSYKNLMRERFDCKVGLKSPAHITIVPPFWMEGAQESLLLKDVDVLAGNLAAFAVATNNFSAFTPRTIFIAVQDNEELKRLKKTADDFFKQKAEYKIKIDSRRFHPHITIATRDLHKKTFQEAWTLFETEPFQEQWVATGLSVLRHNKKNWDIIHTAAFTTPPTQPA